MMTYDPLPQYGVRPIDAPCQGAFPVQSSVLNEVALAKRVLVDYPLARPLRCSFLERGDSDIYRVDNADSRFFLKIFRPPHTGTAAEAEARFVCTLHSLGVDCVPPIKRNDSRYATTIDAPEGSRPALLFEQAPPPLPADLDASYLRNIGLAVARLHTAADRLPIENTPINEPADTFFQRARLYPLPYLSRGQQKTWLIACDKAKQYLDRLPTAPPFYGPCHADLVLSNIRAEKDGRIVLFDFGNAGWSWRALEFAIVYSSIQRRNQDRMETLWQAFVSGYADSGRDVEPLLEHLQGMRVIRQIGFITGASATCHLRMGIHVVEGDMINGEMRHLEGLMRDAEW